MSLKGEFSNSMEIFYFIVFMVVSSIIFGLISRHKNLLSHFSKAVGYQKLIVFLALSLLFLFMSLRQENGINSIILPTTLGLVLNGLIFTIIIEYLKVREGERREIEKLGVMEEVIGNTVYYFQSCSLIDFDSYRDGRTALHKIQWSTIEKISNHYKKPSEIKEHELNYFPALGRILKDHSQIYSSMLGSTYSSDENLVRIWTEIVFSNERLYRYLYDFKASYEQCKDDFERRGLIYITGHNIHDHFSKLLTFNEYKNKKTKALSTT